MSDYHRSVLLQETIDALNVQAGKKYIDATLGGGGHTEAILRAGGCVLGIDTDNEAITYCKKKLKSEHEEFITNKKVVLIRGNFREIDHLSKQHGFDTVAGILFDLGVSSYQLDKPERGFSFRHSGPLDMRMDDRLGVTAKDLLHALGKRELQQIFLRFGEEYKAAAIAKAIIAKRAKKPIETTTELADIIRSVYRGSTEGIDPATKVFQALRIVVNDELYVLEEVLPKAIALLQPKGRLVVISFHSLEDRIVKESFVSFEKKGLGKILTKKPLVPSSTEQEQNRRSRSAKLRIFERV